MQSSFNIKSRYAYIYYCDTEGLYAILLPEWVVLCSQITEYSRYLTENNGNLYGFQINYNWC
jgi:hypothetical protein